MTTLNLNCPKCEQAFALPTTAKEYLATADYANSPFERVITDAFEAGMRAASVGGGFRLCPTCREEGGARCG